MTDVLTSHDHNDQLMQLASSDASFEQWQQMAGQLLEQSVPGSSLRFQPSLSLDSASDQLQRWPGEPGSWAGALDNDWWWVFEAAEQPAAQLQATWRLVRQQWRLRGEREAALARAEMETWLISSISHDLRSPLAGVMGVMDQLAASSPPEQWRESLELGRQSTHKMQSLLDQVLDFYRLRADRLTLAAEAVNILDLVGHVCSEVLPRAQSKGLELSYRVDPGVPDALCVDPQRLEQVMANLLTNAAKFTEDGQVAIALGYDAGDQTLRLEVSDTGVGMTETELASVFQPFRQTGRGEKTGVRGFGLGLNIVDQLVRLMGGRIDVESQVGEGTVFTIALPLEPAADPLATQYAAALSGRRVLVIDNNPRNRDLLARLLGYLGVEYELASSGPEGVFFWSTREQINGRIDQILISDDLNGVGATETLRQMRQQLGRDETMPEVLWLSAQAVDPGNGKSERLSRPVTLRALYQKLAFSDEPALSMPDGADADADADANSRDLAWARILVVDDTPLNLTLASIQLERLGVAVTTAESGTEALAKLELERFDLIFMDIMMPGMDGYETTGHIRQWQRRNDQTGTPVIALTANALQADLARCKAAGMDDLLAKPYRPEELEAIVRQHLGWPGATAEKPGDDPAPPAEPESALVDWTLALKLVGNDSELLVSILGPFVEELPATLNQLEQSVSAGDFPLVQRRAHSLKGMLKTFGAVVMADHAKALEHSAASGEATKVADAWQALDANADATRQALMQFQGANG